MNMWRKSGTCAAAAVLATIGVVTPGASPAWAVCGPVDIVGLNTVIGGGERVDYDIDPGSCATSGYDVLVTGATAAFDITTTATNVSVEARKDMVTEHPQTINIAVKQPGLPIPDDAVTVTLPGKHLGPGAWLAFCVREGGEDPLPWLIRLVLTEVTSVDVRFTYAFEPGTAGFADFTPMGNGHGVVPAGGLSATIPVTLNVDQLAEGNEWFQLMITSISGATILDGGGSCRNEIAANRT